jgi:uncharacterized protein (TIGR02611 family)
LIDRLKGRRERHLEHGLIYRGAFVVAGLIVLLAGVAMLVLPGPAFIVIPVGLAMLALEFAWAENLLEKALERAEAAKDAAANSSTRERVLGGLAIALAIGAAVAVVVIYDVPGLPV